LGNNPIFEDKRKLSPHYIPKKLTGRKEEMRKLVRCFKPVLKGGVDQKVIVIGPTGSGKTSLGIVFGRELESYGEGICEGVEWVRTNCRRWRTSWQVLGDLFKSSNVGSEPRGLGEEEILERIAQGVGGDRTRYVFMVDDLDTLINRDDAEFLYTLSRIGEESGDMSNLSLVLSLEDKEALEDLDEATRSTLLHNYLRLGEYDQDQIYEILRRRESIALKQDAVEDDVLDLLSEEASSDGDAGIAISTLREAGEICVREGEDKIVPEHAWRAIRRSNSTPRREKLAGLSDHELFVLLALARFLEGSGGIKPLMTQLHGSYVALCENREKKPRKYACFYHYLRELENRNLVEKFPSRTRTKELGLVDSSPERVRKAVENRLDDR